MLEHAEKYLKYPGAIGEDETENVKFRSLRIGSPVSVICNFVTFRRVLDPDHVLARSQLSPWTESIDLAIPYTTTAWISGPGT
jgi:SH3-like domain-containing protein